MVNQIVIDGTTLDHYPTTYSPELVIFGSDARNLDGSMSRQLNKIKYIFELDNLTVTDWQTIMRIFSRRSSAVTYRDDMYIVQTLNGDGATTQFYLGRYAYASATDCVAWIDGVQKSITFTTAINPSSTQVFINQSNGLVTCGSTPSDGYDNIEIYYQPIYYVQMNTKLSYYPGIIYGYKAILEEV